MAKELKAKATIEFATVNMGAVGRARQALVGFGASGKAVSDVGARIRAFAAGPLNLLASTGRRALQVVQNLARRLVMVGAVAGAATVALGVALTRGAIKASAEMENLGVRLETVFQGNKRRAQEMMKFAVAMAGPSPFEVAPIVEAAVQLEVYGLNAKKWLPLVGDLAAASGRDIVAAAMAVAKATVGESERLKELGITSRVLKEMGVNVNEAGAISTQTAEDVDKLTAALEKVISTRFAGGMTRFATTWKGVTSSLSDAWKGFLRDVGEAGVFEKAKSLAQRLLRTLDELASTGRLKRIAAAISGILTAFLKLFGVTAEKLEDPKWVDAFIKNLEKAQDWVEKTLPKAFGVAVGIIVAVWNWLEKKLTAVFAALQDSGKGFLDQLVDDFDGAMLKLDARLTMFVAKYLVPAIAAVGILAVTLGAAIARFNPAAGAELIAKGIVALGVAAAGTVWWINEAAKIAAREEERLRRGPIGRGESPAAKAARESAEAAERAMRERLAPAPLPMGPTTEAAGGVPPAALPPAPANLPPGTRFAPGAQFAPAPLKLSPPVMPKPYVPPGTRQPLLPPVGEPIRLEPTTARADNAPIYLSVYIGNEKIEDVTCRVVRQSLRTAGVAA